MKTVACVALVVCSAASLGAQTFSDDNFSSGWTTTPLFLNGGATVSATTITTGGSGTPPYRQVQHGNAGQVFVAHMNSAAVWNPATQAIASFDYEFDIRSFGTASVQGDMMFGLLLEQGGTYFATVTDQTTPVWATHTHFNPTSFTAIAGPPVPDEVPDLSCKGAPITFGYMSKTNVATPINITGGLDRWSVTIHPDPNPANGCCISAAVPDATCNANGTFTVSTTVMNTSGHSVQAVLIGPPPGATYTVTPNVVNGPFANNASIPVTVTVSGASPGQSICLRYYLQDTATETCCMVEHCFDLPKCACMEVLNASIGCDPDPAAAYAYTFTLHNLTTMTLQQVFVMVSPGSVKPQLINTPIPPGGSIPVTLHLSGVNAGTVVSIVLQAYGDNMDPCCTLKVQITMPPITTPCD